jgi:hypothetical protein
LKVYNFIACYIWHLFRGTKENKNVTYSQPSSCQLRSRIGHPILKNCQK